MATAGKTGQPAANDPTINQRLVDAQVGHQVDLQAYSNDVVRRMIAVLNKADPELYARLAAAIDNLDASEFTVDRLEQLLGSVRSMNVQAYAQINRELTEELRQFATYEAGWQRQLFSSVVPPQVVTQVGVVAINAEQVYTAALARPFQGRLLREWASGIEQARMIRIRDAVRMGYVQQETVSQIITRVRGTRAAGYSDGLLEIDRRDAEAVVRTAISHVAGVTRDRMIEANGDLVKATQWVSTLDGSTSELCRIRDGKEYTVDKHKPIGHSVPWLAGPGRLHWRCRSTSAPVVKSWAELGLKIGEADKSTRSSMDGQVAEDMTYGAWLKRQSAARQDEILGPTRGALMRRGGMEMDQFYTAKGVYLSLDDLRARDAGAFKAAGL